MMRGLRAIITDWAGQFPGARFWVDAEDSAWIMWTRPNTHTYVDVTYVAQRGFSLEHHWVEPDGDDTVHHKKKFLLPSEEETLTQLSLLL